LLNGNRLEFVIVLEHDDRRATPATVRRARPMKAAQSIRPMDGDMSAALLAKRAVGC
jgi:hypothetical protein